MNYIVSRRRVHHHLHSVILHQLRMSQQKTLQLLEMLKMITMLAVKPLLLMMTISMTMLQTKGIIMMTTLKKETEEQQQPRPQQVQPQGPL